MLAPGWDQEKVREDFFPPPLSTCFFPHSLFFQLPYEQGTELSATGRPTTLEGTRPLSRSPHN